MTRLYLGIGAAVIITLGYLFWHHHVYQQGYEARVAEEAKTREKAKPTIKKEQEDYEANVEAAFHAPKGSCGDIVDPAISAVLDRL